MREHWADNPWVCWLVLFFLAQLDRELVVIWGVAFTIYCVIRLVRLLRHILKWFVWQLRCWNDRRAIRRRERHRAADRRKADLEWERQRPVREAEARRQNTDQRRREDARAACEIFYDVHAPEISTRFPRTMLQDYLQRYLGDDRPVDEVERRGQQLLALLQSHLNKANPHAQSGGVDGLIAWHKETRAKIQALQLKPDETETLLAHIDNEFDERMRNILLGDHQ